MDTRNEEKKTRLLDALEKGMVQVHLDARRPGVLVPKKFATNHHLVLNISFRFEPPDLSVNDWGVRETLSFGGERFTVGVPWSSLYAIASHVSHDFFMYPEDMPEELLQGAVEKQKAEHQKTEQSRGPRSEIAAALAEVASGAPQALEDARPSGTVLREVLLEETGGADQAPKEPTPPRRGHLRIVK